MMGSCNYDQEYQFFDAYEDISIISESGSDFDSISTPEICKPLSDSAQFDVWLQNPGSVQERRSKFLKWLDLDVRKISVDNSSDSVREADRITSSDYGVSSRSSSASFLSMDHCESSRFEIPRENCVCRVGNNHSEVMGDVGVVNREPGSDGSALFEQAGYTSGSSSSSGGLSPVRNPDANLSPRTTKRVKKWWLDRLRSFTCVVERHEDSCDSDAVCSGGIHRVKVHQWRKRTKELSALYLCQEIQAHDGLILTMRFSPDGKYLASAGQDGVVRIWQVVEDERSNELDVPSIDSSCVYFTTNHVSELIPLCIEKEKLRELQSLKRTADSACVVVPSEVFRMLEKPLHEFQGHSGEILDLSWSTNNYLLSSSMDKTVRLWRVGHDHCLNVFPHSNYVTCVQFNPMDDNYFVSGSLDGKIRIWERSSCHVVSWTEMKDIITAVCYHPDGQGVIVGSMTGDCRIYSISDNHFQLDARTCLHSKKKSSAKRITGIQFFPQDANKVMVTSADSQVRILQGTNVIGKYKGQRGAGNSFAASFTSDGKHIISASEDSSVYVWNCIDHDSNNSLARPKKVKSYERFLCNASVALPWHGFKTSNPGNGPKFVGPNARSPSSFSFSESYYRKGSATWPEEKLSSHTGLVSSIHRSEYKFLRKCQSVSETEAWGLVIVTAGSDGRIRSFINYGLPVPI